MDIEKAIKKCWDSIEAQIGLPIIEGSGRKMIEDWANIPMTKDPVHLEDALLDLERFNKAVKIVNYLRKGKPDKKSTKVKGMGVKAHQIAVKNFQRRVSIAEFVLFNMYTTHELFYNLYTNKHLPKRRIDWKAILSEWNKKHPSDIMSTTNVFRTTFYRILREQNVLADVLKKAINKQVELVLKKEIPLLSNEVKEALDKEAKAIFEYLNKSGQTRNPEFPQQVITEGIVRRTVYSSFLLSAVDYENDTSLEPRFPLERLSVMHEFIKTLNKQNNSSNLEKGVNNER